MTTDEKFQAAVNIIRSLPKDGPYQPSHDMMLKFYGLYKQAVEGPCTDPKPAFYEVVKGYKWRAWSNLGDMTQAQAKSCYVEELKKIIETMAYTENVANFIDALGPFYEFVDIPGKKKINNNTKGLPGGEDLSDFEGNDNLPIINGSITHQENGFESGSSASSSHVPSPQPPSPSHATSTPMSLAQEHKEADRGGNISGDDDDEEEEEEEEEEEVVTVEVTSHESGVTTHQVSVTTNIYSDSDDSDEEYSEPAESPDHLAQMDCEVAEVPLSSSSSHTLHLSHTQISPRISPPDITHNLIEKDEAGESDGFVMCGGGDKSHPGGLQMTPRQTSQASRFHAGRGIVRSGGVFSPGHGDSQGIGGAGGSSGGGGSGGDGGSGGSGGGGGAGSVQEDVSAQLVLVLRRLQTDMESVLHRLNNLETLTVTQHQSVCHHCQGTGGGGGVSVPSSSRQGEKSWWPFPELSPRSTFFLLLWPIILHGGFKLLPLIRCRRKRP
ncbi:hypothetical protein Pmani_027105 [Petrolisthes manimaculis]|uniref:ACB domain-containing protein n=1 Tax=Petrolisthes manimaculis TaxID=1843537 RepID=A0AAE1P4B4_9EUCA|nr:hypothetical protein Pmani_027105 [Petrolisthes manimaculis]